MEKRFHEFLQFTDPHFLAEPCGRLKDVHTRESFARVLDAALAAEARPDGILLTGDVTQDGSREGYVAIRALLEATGLEIWSLSGNHDDPDNMAEILSGGAFHYCEPIRAGSWLLPMLSTWDGDRGGGRISDDDLAGLDRLLAEDPLPHALVCLHHQPDPMGCAWLDGVALDNRADFMAVIERHEKVRGLLWGHVHQARDDQAGRLRLLSTPSTCFQFVPHQDEFGLDSQPPGYRRLRLFEDGRIESEVVRVPAS